MKEEFAFKRQRKSPNLIGTRECHKWMTACVANNTPATLTAKEVADRFDVNITTVYKLRKKIGADIPTKRINVPESVNTHARRKDMTVAILLAVASALAGALVAVCLG
jgi:hypothetical protein